ncbi:hypothetical protein D9C73_000710 [Collichthys lucidus]|uniref:Uncharacterized protein n=1 Tax=Collichthys lucidus TaxID=240159 RepID=A0A4U5TYC1_COLLU|nr:hypothetical protein D9C73_000710 [Collichthys lucidus]
MVGDRGRGRSVLRGPPVTSPAAARRPAASSGQLSQQAVLSGSSYQGDSMSAQPRCASEGGRVVHTHFCLKSVYCEYLDGFTRNHQRVECGTLKTSRPREQGPLALWERLLRSCSIQMVQIPTYPIPSQGVNACQIGGKSFEIISQQRPQILINTGAAF